MKISFHRPNNFEDVDESDFADHVLDKKYIQSGKPVLMSFNAALQQHIQKILITTLLIEQLCR